MAVYVVPCGVSLLDGLKTKMTGGPPNAKTASLVENATDLGRTVLELADADVVPWWAAHAVDDAEDARLLEWDPRVLCAETSTLAASRYGSLRGLLDGSNRVLVLASDTGRGVASALYLAQRLAGLDLGDVSYASSPEQLSSAPLDLSLQPGTLTVLRLRGLDPRHAAGGFIDAIASIGQALRAAFDLGERMEVHLSGGFKATLLYVLAMTELLHSIGPERVSARYLFEDSDSEIMKIGMRQFSQAWCRDMRAELRALRDDQDYKGIPTLTDLVWDKAAGKLNAFGYGYLAVLDEPLTPLPPGPLGP